MGTGRGQHKTKGRHKTKRAGRGHWKHVARGQLFAGHKAKRSRYG